MLYVLVFIFLLFFLKKMNNLIVVGLIVAGGRLFTIVCRQALEDRIRAWWFIIVYTEINTKGSKFGANEIKMRITQHES